MIKFNVDKVRTFINQKNKELIKGTSRKVVYSNNCFAYDNDINKGSLCAILNGINKKPGIEMVYKIAKGMNCTMESLLIFTKYDN